MHKQHKDLIQKGKGKVLFIQDQGKVSLNMFILDVHIIQRIHVIHDIAQRNATQASKSISGKVKRKIRINQYNYTSCSAVNSF